MTVAVARIEGFDVVSPGPDALFAAGSISKFVTALGALLLVDRGALELDADVHGTTLRALGHTSGASVEFFPGYERDAQVPTIDDVLAGRAPASNEPVKLDDDARGTFRYSGGGYALVQRLIEDAVGAPFADVMRQVVLAPLRLLLAAGGTRFGHFGGAHGFTSAFDVSSIDGTGAVATSDVHNGLSVVLPQLVEALGEPTPATAGT
jgi:CubicO group peptidase (beta-lactamase class C family)